ncbi:MAG: hypothetical protein HY332_05950 [Chloroflexi bacterium]|nr:hypothetical protein [Chloroflexota bacterium]
MSAGNIPAGPRAGGAPDDQGAITRAVGGTIAARHVTADDLAACRDWTMAHLLTPGRPPFAFVYGGRPFAELAGSWRVSRETDELDGRRTRHRVVYLDPASGLEVRCVAVAYRDFPTVEWTLYFRNTGAADTPILQDIQALDVAFGPPYDTPVPPRGVVLHHATGSSARADDYRPLETVLRPGGEVRLAARGGRPSDTDLPFFNLVWPAGGVVVAVGWLGQWAGQISRDAGANVRIRAARSRRTSRCIPQRKCVPL